VKSLFTILLFWLFQLTPFLAEELPDPRDYEAPTHGLAMFGVNNLKLAPGEPFPYVRPDAPRGGHLKIGLIGDFNKLNRWSLRGLPFFQINDWCLEKATELSKADDEPYSIYGRLVESIEVAKDRKSLIYNIHPKAHFSDGHPVTAEDFEFSLRLLFDPGHIPTQKHFYEDVVEIRILGPKRILYRFKKKNTELPMLLGNLDIYPKHIYGAAGKRFGESFDNMPPVGSGPYQVESFEFGTFITFKKDPHWWGKDLSINRGRFNFARITYRYFKDPLALREAFKTGEIHVLPVGNPRDWVKEYNGPYFQKKYIRKEALPHDRVINIPGFFFNLRRHKLKNPLVRKALSMVFDHEWINREMYYGRARRVHGIFENNRFLKSEGLPRGRVLKILKDMKKRFPEAFPYASLKRDLSPPGQNMETEKARHLAGLLLDKAGWLMGEDGLRHDEKGQSLTLVMPLIGSGALKLVEPYMQSLEKIGVRLKPRIFQSAQWQKKRKEFDFDLIQFGYSWPGNRNPGIKHKAWWGSEMAYVTGTHNVMGLDNPAVDAALDRIIAAQNREDYLVAIEVLDRIMTHLDICIPLFYIPDDWILYWNFISPPPRHASHLSIVMDIVSHWYWDSEKQQALENAMREQRALP
jgi:microcin C transport system substrate-binding protein